MLTPLNYLIFTTVVLAAYPDRWRGGWSANAQTLPKPYAIDGYTYLGCYFEPQGYRMLNDTFALEYGMSGCQDRCRRQNMRYAGMELRDQCFCGNTVTPKDGWQKDESKCDQLCYRNPDEVCGGFGWMALYSRGGASLPTQSKPSPTPQPAPSSSLPQAPASSSPQQQPQAPASSSSPIQQPMVTGSKTQNLGGPASSAASEEAAASTELPSSSASSESQLFFSFGSSTGTAAPVASSDSLISQTASASGGSQSSTLAPVAPLLPQTTAMGDVPGSTPHFKDRKQIPLMGVNLTSAGRPQLSLQPLYKAFLASALLYCIL